MTEYFYVDVLMEDGDPVREEEVARFIGIKKAASHTDRNGYRRVTFYCDGINQCQNVIIKLLTHYELFESVEFGIVPIQETQTH